ncbi:MAG TPA: hypothetical protein VNE62_07300 [Actinomycetota bacterium]|nr:hypothetical protein [Actinomycetota bacterium]
MKRVLCLLGVVAALAVSCKDPPRYGNGDGPSLRPGASGYGFETPSPSPSVAAPGASTNPKVPAPTARPTPAPTPTPPAPTFLDIELVADSPYYKPGNEITLPLSHTLRVTNRDQTAERPCRTFADSRRSFSSPCLKPGESWSRLFLAPVSYQIADPGLPFAPARLDVVR